MSEPRKVYDPSDVLIRRVDEDNAKIGISRRADPKKATEEAVNKIGGMCAYVKPGDMVAIKLNITGGISTNKASFTSPEVASKIVDMVRKCGGKPFAFDSSMIWTDVEPIAKKSGWYDWGNENHIEVIDLHHMPVIPFDFGEGSLLGHEKASKPLQESDVLITIAKMKTHLLTTVSMGLKNNYGNLPRADKGIYHGLGIDTAIVDVNRAFPTTLAIIDGTIAGEGEAGPLTPDPIQDYNTVFASNDVVCADSVASIFMGFESPMSVRHIKFASVGGSEGKLDKVGNGFCYLKEDVQKEIQENFGKHPKDGNFVLPDPRVVETLADLTKLIARQPGGASLLNNLADIGLGNLSYFFTKPMSDLLKNMTRMQSRFIGKNLDQSWDINGMNLHPEDERDFNL